ncbi:subtilisin-like serine protease, partial [Tulasnella sp. 419]
ATFYTCDGPKEEGSYIVKLKSHAVKQSFMATCCAAHTDQLDITHSFEDSTLFHGFVAKCSEEVLDALRDREDVEYICEDAIMRCNEVQEDATWNLHRISHKGQANPPLEYLYPDSGGEGVNVYVLDTGIVIGHSEFEGRAKNGGTFYPSFDDVNGHGTHIAGTIIGRTYGVAKKAEAFAVRVLDDRGSGPSSIIIAGIAWAVSHQESTGKPSVINMSIGGPANRAIDDAVNNAASRGIPVVVAAGGERRDAKDSSPARAAGAYAVGAIDRRSNRARFSNFGDVVKVYAPGVDIVSAGITGPYATATFSGTSMAAAHVSGAFALYISANGPGVTTARIWDLIRDNTDTTGDGLHILQI